VISGMREAVVQPVRLRFEGITAGWLVSRVADLDVAADTGITGKVGSSSVGPRRMACLLISGLLHGTCLHDDDNNSDMIETYTVHVQYYCRLNNTCMEHTNDGSSRRGGSRHIINPL
jgi:hypothetical protein